MELLFQYGFDLCELSEVVVVRGQWLLARGSDLVIVG